MGRRQEMSVRLWRRGLMHELAVIRYLMACLRKDTADDECTLWERCAEATFEIDWEEYERYRCTSMVFSPCHKR